MKTSQSCARPSSVVLAVCALIGLATPALSVEPTIAARAYAIYADLPGAGLQGDFILDTGFLPATGGNNLAAAPTLNVTGLASSVDVIIQSSGDRCGGHSYADFGATTVLAGQPGEFHFDSLRSDDDDECCDDHHHRPGSSNIVGLHFGGVSVTVSGAYGQVVGLTGVGTLTINELEHHDDDDDCDDDNYSMNALHLRLDNGDEIIVGSSYFESDDACCPLPTVTSTWGEIKTRFE